MSDHGKPLIDLDIKKIDSIRLLLKRLVKFFYNGEYILNCEKDRMISEEELEDIINSLGYVIDINDEKKDKITLMSGQIKTYEKKCKEYRDKIDKLEKELDRYKPKDFITNCGSCNIEFNWSELNRKDKAHNCECGCNNLCEECGDKYYKYEKNHSGYLDVTLKKCPVCERRKK